MADLGTISAIGIPSGLLVVLGYMGWQVRAKQDTKTCQEINGAIKADLSKGEEKFDKMNDTLTDLRVDIKETSTMVKYIAKQNGYKED